MSSIKDNLGSGNLLSFSHPKLIPPDKRGGLWELAEDWKVTYLGHVIDIPAGFQFDGASIPCWLRPICGDPLQVPRLYAAIVHDYIYMMHALPRDVADELYRNMLSLLGYPLQAWVEYPFIRAAGWLHW